jgi:hypothetical protein
MEAGEKKEIMSNKIADKLEIKCLNAHQGDSGI